MTAVLSPKTYRGVDVSFATGPLVRATFPPTGPNHTPMQYDQRFVPVAGRHPYPLTPQPLQKQLLLEVTLVMPVDGTGGDEIETFLALFDGGLGEQPLIATDGTTDWQVDASVLRLEHTDGIMNHWVVTLQATDPIWRKTTDSTDTNTATAVTTLAIDATALGNQRAPLIVEATPSVVKGQANDQIHGRQVVIAWRAPAAGLNYPIAIQMDTATETTANMLANGDDLRVIVDNVEVQRDLGTMDAALTNIWFVADWTPARSATIKAAMTAGSPATDADWDLGPLADTTNLPDSGVLLIGTEAIHYTSKDPNGRTLKGITRAVQNTTAATHAVADVAYYVEHDIWLVYGHSAATAPTIDSDRSPLFLLEPASSNNAQWKWDATRGMATENGRRPGQWKPVLIGTNTGMATRRGKWNQGVNYLPTANGSQNDFIPFGDASEYLCVDDPVGTPDDDTTYANYTAAVASNPVSPPVQLFTFPIPALSDGGYYYLSATARYKRVGGTSSIPFWAFIIGGITHYVDNTGPAVTTSYVNRTQGWVLNPLTDRYWTADDLAGLQFGAGLSGNDADFRLTSLYLTVQGIDHDETALALGAYEFNPLYLAQFANADGWQFTAAIPIRGAGAVRIDYEMGPTFTANQLPHLYGIDTSGAVRVLSQGISVSASFPGLTEVDAAFEQGYSSAGPGLGLVAAGMYWPSSFASEGFAIIGATLKWDTDYTPSVVVGAAQSIYVHRWTLTQEDDADKAITVLFVSPLNKKLTVDTDAGLVTFEDAGRLGLSALSLSTQRRDWLELLAGPNELTWADASNGAGVIAVTLTWRDRRN